MSRQEREATQTWQGHFFWHRAKSGLGSIEKEVAYVTEYYSHASGKKFPVQAGKTCRRWWSHFYWQLWRAEAALTPVTSAMPRKRLGILEGKLTIPDDFDAPLPPDILAAFEGNWHAAVAGYQCVALGADQLPAHRTCEGFAACGREWYLRQYCVVVGNRHKDTDR